MKVLFVIPHQQVKYKPSVDLPLGVLMIASYMRMRNWAGNIEIYDATLSGELWKDKDDKVYLGDKSEAIYKKIKEADPDVIGISNMFTWQMEQALAVAELAKKACPKAINVIGGPHVSSFPREMIKEKNIDYVVMGEGEIRFHELIKCIESGETPLIEGVIGKDEDLSLLKPSKRSPIRFIQNLDEMPIPAYELINIDRYFLLQSRGMTSRPRNVGKRTVSILTSRGCPHQCVFCSIQTTMGYKWRYHSPQYVKKHIEYLVDHYAVDYIHFEDDNFTHDPNRFDEILDCLISMKSPIRWDTPNGVRGDTWTEERVRKAKAAGCQYLIVAIESGVQRVVDKVVKKRLDLSQVDDLMRFCMKVKLRLFAFYIIGLPGETEKEINQTIDFAIDKLRKYNVFPTVSKIKTLPGTELYDVVHNNRLSNVDSSSEESDFVSSEENAIVTDEFSPPLIEKIYTQFLIRLSLVMVYKSIVRPDLIVLFLKLISGYRWFILRLLTRRLTGGV